MDIYFQHDIIRYHFLRFELKHMYVMLFILHLLSYHVFNTFEIPNFVKAQLQKWHIKNSMGMDLGE